MNRPKKNYNALVENGFGRVDMPDCEYCGCSGEYPVADGFDDYDMNYCNCEYGELLKELDDDTN